MIARIGPKKLFEIAMKEGEWEGLQKPDRPVSPDFPHGAEISATSLYMPPDLKSEQWEEVGRKLITVEKGSRWAVADWWVYGRHKYGDRTKIAKALRYDVKSLMNMGRVARKVPASLRSEVLDFWHHEAVATLEPEQQKRWLDRAVQQNWSVNTLKQKIADSRNDGEPDPVELAIRWANDFIDQAKRQSHPWSDPGKWDDQTLSHFSEHLLTEMINAGRDAARTWTEAVEHLERYRDSRPTEADEKDERDEEEEDVKPPKKKSKKDDEDEDKPAKSSARRKGKGKPSSKRSLKRERYDKSRRAA